MSGAPLHPAVTELLALRRLTGVEPGGPAPRPGAPRRHFTVSREKALLRLREQALARAKAVDEDEWLWTLAVVRAANALSEHARAHVHVELSEDPSDEAVEVIAIDVVVPGFSFAAFELQDLLAGALEPDLGAPLRPELLDDDLRYRRFRMLIGRAINDALAGAPLAVELHTGVGGRRFERREQVSADRDPYTEARLPGLDTHSRFIIRLLRPRAGIGARLGRWVRGRTRPEEVIAELWARWRLREDGRHPPAVDEHGQLSLAPDYLAEPLTLGEHARIGPTIPYERSAKLSPALHYLRHNAPFSKEVLLVRDGVISFSISNDLAAAGMAQIEHGWIDCPSLRLTADERAIVHDANFDLLLAWLGEYAHRRSQAVEASERALDAGRDEEGERGEETERARDAEASTGSALRWPEDPFAELETAAGEPRSHAELAEEVRRGRELVYVWRHRAAQLPYTARQRVLSLWPSALAPLRAAFPDARFVPLQALGDQSRLDPEDLSSLRAGSHDPLVLVRDAPVELPARDGEAPARVRISVEAYVHRSQTATMGFISILAYERRVAQLTERALVFPGMTLLCRVSPDVDSPELGVAALRRDQAAVTALAAATRQRALDHWEAVIAHVMRRAQAWETPLLRGALDQLNGPSLGLCYRSTDAGLRLSWRDTALLGVEVGRLRDPSDSGSPTRDLRDALRQLRDRGAIVVAHPRQRYPSLLSSDPQLAPWQLPSWSRPLLERVLGPGSLLDMPTAPDAYPLVAAAEEQRVLLRDRALINTDLQNAPNDEFARLRLLGHLLVARVLGRDTLGLEGVPLLLRYDPRAMTSTSLVSLDAATREQPRPPLVPPGAVHRGLPAPVISATPGQAALMGALGFEGASLEPPAGHLSARAHDPEPRLEAPVRRRARSAPPLLAATLATPQAIGTLQIAADGSSTGISLWSGGLRRRTLELPEPLGRVSGRLVLTTLGAKLERTIPDSLERIITTHARDLLADALHQRALLSPLGPQRQRLDHLIDYARARVRAGDPFELAAPLGIAPTPGHDQRIASLRRMSLEAAPLRPLPHRREALLAQVVSQSLAMNVRFDTAILSWRAAKLGKRHRDGALELEFGLRNAWIQRALDEDHQLDPPTHRRAALLAGLLVVTEFFHQARGREDLELGPEHLSVALWRLLELAQG
ncbi:hypothetical protein G6O69_04625 [Pseudenhygromyxa sp. WMMC2535]|uniref:hypothetical protein n=1 Tax=Pseudenhygromyxa sp. WMMC2535 TaxID=2712867 RepID=UPI0015530776|nr:hypothetical protein [Pseudenhygromyxa sp. WMMC2535]NVB37103.1 hypothetical protein [Pseudenhygromyxa sp. WMMC2535]